MLMIPIKSSNISAAGHENNVLRIQFSNGINYDYPNVPVETFNSFLEAKSQGKFFNQNIRGKLQGKKVKGENDG